METKLLEEILNKISKKRLVVLGDYFLDFYINLDRSLSELSLETHKEAFQATGFRSQPGAAGVVTSNLVSLGAKATAVGYIGQDSFGLTLKKALSKSGVDTNHLIERNDRLTPTYTKPIMKEVDGINVELNRIDIINRTPNPQALNDLLVTHLEKVFSTHDGVLVLEQVRNDGCGVLSPYLRNALSNLENQHPDIVVLVDSRHFLHEYHSLSLKMNLSEGLRSLDMIADQTTFNQKNQQNATNNCLDTFWMLNNKPVFISLGEEGICGIDKAGKFYHPGFHQDGPIDVVGAGDSVLAAIGVALCAGASPKQAAYIGNLVGSIIVQKIGTTGVATPKEIFHRHLAYQKQQKGIN